MVQTPTEEAKTIVMEALRRISKIDPRLESFGDYKPRELRRVWAALAKHHDQLGESVKGLDFFPLLRGGTTLPST